MIQIPKGTPLKEVTSALDRLADPEAAKRKFEQDIKLLKSELPILYGDQLFTWTDPEDQQLYHLNSTALYRYWRHNTRSGERCLVPITEVEYKFALENRGIERYRVDRLTIDALQTPIIMIQQHTLNKDWTICIDGSHRMVWAYENQIPLVKCVLFQQKEWRRCRVFTPGAEIPAPKWSGIL